MALPDIQCYVWLAEKTESSGVFRNHTAPEVVRFRAPETVLDEFRIDASDIVQLEFTDGISEVDDTFSMTLLPAPGRELFERLRLSPLYPIFGFTVNNRFFGPYDLESGSFSGEAVLYSFSGRIDREFEDTLIDKWFTAFQSRFSFVETALDHLIDNTWPYAAWNLRSIPNSTGVVKAFILGKVWSAKNLSGVRGALNPFNIGISPQSTVTIVPHLNHLTYIERDLEIYPKYPTIFGRIAPAAQHINVPHANFAGGRLSSVVPGAIRRWVEVPTETIRMGNAPSVSIPDWNNAPGAWRNRRIDLAIRELAASVKLYQSGTDLPRLILDGGKQNPYVVIDIENARWKLQNTSATASITVHGYPFYIAGQLVTITTDLMAYPNWRVDSVKHTISPDNGYETSLSLVLWQGLPTYTGQGAPHLEIYDASDVVAPEETETAAQMAEAMEQDFDVPWWSWIIPWPTGIPDVEESLAEAEGNIPSVGDSFADFAESEGIGENDDSS